MIQLEKAKRLLSIETSIANLYQKMMDSEKEKNIDPIYYMYLEEEKKPEELEFYSDFSISTRLQHLILDYFYSDIKALWEIHSLDDVLIEDVYKLRQNKLLHEKARFAYLNVVFLSFLQLIQKKIQMNFYKEEFSSLKYRLLFSYPYLESQMMMGKMATLTNSHVLLYFAFRYGLSIQSVIGELKENNESDIKRVINDLVFFTHQEDFYLERTYLLLKARLLNESDTTCTYLENFIGSLIFKKSKEVKRVLEDFKEVKDLRSFQVFDSTNSGAYLRSLELTKGEES